LRWCTEDDIRRRADEIYLTRVERGEPGDEKEDWSGLSER
jgi:hypothetical protein